ncbi:MAG: magnesium transporter [Defluviicoccus sp.]
MSDLAPESKPAASPDFPVGLATTLVEAVVAALAAGDAEAAGRLIEPLYAADTADLVESLNTEQRQLLVGVISKDLLPAVLAELDDTVRDEIIAELGLAETAAAVADLETDDALLVISDLDAEDQKLVLAAMPPPDRALIAQALAYPEYSAGRLMQRELVALPLFWTVGETIDHLRQTAEHDADLLPTAFYDVFVVDPKHRPVGSLSLSRLIRARRQVPLSELMQTDLKVLRTTTDQEDVAFVFRQRDLTSAPVVDEGGRLVGVVTIDDVVDVIDEEHEDDIMHLGGVSEDDFYRASFATAQARFTWLLVNLGTAVLASAVIGLFDATIEEMVALAVLMPIVASMGGNAGTQTLTVAVRALATKQLTPTNAMRVISKETMVGFVNGIIFAVITGALAWLWFGNIGLGVVIGLAMVVNLLVAGLSGVVIPLVLDWRGIDPAVASSVFLTTLTDVIGFFAFLGLATWLLL